MFCILTSEYCCSSISNHILYQLSVVNINIFPLISFCSTISECYQIKLFHTSRFWSFWFLYTLFSDSNELEPFYQPFIKSSPEYIEGSIDSTARWYGMVRVVATIMDAPILLCHVLCFYITFKQEPDLKYTIYWYTIDNYIIAVNPSVILPQQLVQSGTKIKQT